MDFALFVGQQLLKLLPLRLQVAVSTAQKLVFILKLETALQLHIHFGLRLPYYLQLPLS
jgi:hypothetical protein